MRSPLSALVLLAVLAAMSAPITAPLVQTVRAQAAPPAAPSGLHPAIITPTSIELRWTDNATDETHYHVLRGLAAQRGVNELLPADTVSWTHEGLLPDTLYAYNVRACNADGCVAHPAGEIRVRTLPAPTATPTATETPTPEPTLTPTPTETSTPTPLPTDTPTPTATPTSTPAPCPGVHVGVVVETNTLTWTCVKATEQPWPSSIEIRDWRTEP